MNLDKYQLAIEVLGVEKGTSQMRRFMTQVALAGPLTQKSLRQLGGAFIQQVKPIQEVRNAIRSFLDSAKGLNKLKLQRMIAVRDPINIRKANALRAITQGTTEQSTLLVNNFSKFSKELSEGGLAKMTPNKIESFFGKEESFKTRVSLARQMNDKLREYSDLEMRGAKTTEQKDKIIEKAQRTSAIIGTNIPLKQKLSTDEKENLKTYNASQSAMVSWSEATRKNIQVTSDHNKIIDEAAKRQEYLNDGIGIAISKLIRYRLAFYAMSGGIRALRDSITIFTDMELALARLEKVLPDNVRNLNNLKNSAFELGTAFSTSAQEVVKSMLIWAQMGLSQNDILKATRATLIGVVSMEETAHDVTEALTSAIYTYGVVVEDAEKVIAKWMAVQADYPVTAGELANAMKIVGSAARQVGVDIDDLTGYVTAINAITRKSGNVIGNSLKTMFARLPRKETIDAFASVGIAVMKNGTEFRDLDDILDDLYKKWGSMNDVQKANLSTILSGIRHYSDFIALMDNYGMKQAAIVKSHQASDEAMRATNLELSTFIKQWESLKVSLTAVAQAMGETIINPLSYLVKSFKSFFDFIGTRGTHVVGKIIMAFVGLATTFIAIKGGFIALKFGLNWATNALISYSSAAGVAGKQTDVLTAKLFALSRAEAASAAGMSAKGLGAITGTLLKFSSFITIVALAISVILPLLGTFGSKASATVNINDDLSRSFSDTANSIEEHIKSIEAENKLLDDNSARLQEYSNQLIVAKKGSKEFADIYSRYANVLKAMPSQYAGINAELLNINKVTAQVTTTTEGLSEAFKNLAKAIGDQKVANEQQISQSKELRDAQMELWDLSIKQQEINAQQKALQYENLYKKIAPKNDVIWAVRSLQDVTNSLNGYTIASQRASVANTSLTKLFAEQPKYLSKLSNEAERLQLKTIKGFHLPPSSAKIYPSREPYKDKLSWGIDASKIFATKEYYSIIEQMMELRDKLYSVGTKETVNPILDTFWGGDFDVAKQIAKEYLNNWIKAIDTWKKDIIDEKNLTPIEEAKLQSINQIYTNSLGSMVDIKLLSKQLQENKMQANNVIVSQRESYNKMWASINAPVNKTTLTLPTVSDDELKSFRASLKDVAFDIEHFFDQYNELVKKRKFGEGIPDLFDFTAKFSTENLDKVSAILKDLQKNTFDAREEFEIYSLLMKNIDSDQLQSIVDSLFKVKDIKLPKTLTKGAEETVKVATKHMDVLDQINKSDNIQEGIRKGYLNTQNRITSAAELTVKAKATELKLMEMLGGSNGYSANELTLTENLNKQYAGINDLLRLQLYNANKLTDNYKNIESLEKQIINNNLKWKDTIAIIGDTSQTVSERVKAAKESYEESVKLLIKMSQIKLDKLWDPVLRGVEVFKDSMNAALSTLPANMLGGAEKRKELTEDLRKAEFELSEARQDGDKKAIAAAEYRVAVIKDELRDYRKGIYEIREAFSALFKTMGSAYWDALVKDFTTKLSNVSLGQLTLGQEFGVAFSKSTTEFTGSFTSALQKTFNDFITEQKLIYDRYLEEEARIHNTTYDTGSWSTQNMDFSSITEAWSNASVGSDIKNALKDGSLVAKGNLKQALISGGMVTAGLITSAFVAKNPSSQTGAQVGELFGPAILGELVPSLVGSAFLGPLGILGGGLLGGLIGGMFGGKNEKPQEQLVHSVDKNTEALERNTLSLSQLDKAIFNAPTRFNVPAFAGSYGNMTINVTSNRADPQEVAGEVVQIIENNYQSASKRYGTRGYTI